MRRRILIVPALGGLLLSACQTPTPSAVTGQSGLKVLAAEGAGQYGQAESRD